MWGFTFERPRERLLRNGVELFAQHGYHGVGVPDLVRAARVALSTFYAHFRSKEEFANFLFEACAADVDRAITDIRLGEGTAREQFHALWSGLIEMVSQFSPAFVFGQTPDTHFLNPENRKRDRVPPPLTLHLSREAFAATLKPLPPRTLAASVWGILLEMDRGYQTSTLPDDPLLLEHFEQCAWDAISLHTS